ncbi:glycosyltransferase [Methyloterricola oryzae]|uniref:glycosyltransferase n=1 Tax=Methyloterricola oryzae TaxID=1495050 RepID=UPI001F17BE70|nr:glycosyltransferase [Methyloterricola oryzae]
MTDLSRLSMAPSLLPSAAAALIWTATLLLPWRPWRNGEILEPSPDAPASSDEITVLIPARDEAEVIQSTLEGLAQQGGSPRVILVDDGSSDGTADLASQVPGLDLSVLAGAPLPEGWSGKLWALEQGLRKVETPYTLLLDADIHLAPGMLAALLERMRVGPVFVSLMASLRMETFWEKLLMPAFIYFFKQLYPFRLANSANPRFASAAGGCILVETGVLRELGGFDAIRGAIIDDCTLAAKVKQAGYRTWTGQSHGVVSLRGYGDLEPIWEMVARTAFTQLRYSITLLATCTFLMVLMFWGPVAGLAAADPMARSLSALGLAGMLVAYLPTLNFYRRNPLWALAMPVIASLYLAMTWTSALRYWRGERSRWKNRVYSREA